MQEAQDEEAYEREWVEYPISIGGARVKTGRSSHRSGYPIIRSLWEGLCIMESGVYGWQKYWASIVQYLELSWRVGHARVRQRMAFLSTLC